MATTKLKKSVQFTRLKDNMSSHEGVILINYNQFVNEQMNRFREEFFITNPNDNLIVGKNSLISLACNDEAKDGMTEKLKGSNMLIFTNDIFSTIRLLNNFTKSLKNYPKIKISISCGILNEKFVDDNKMKLLANIHSVDSLYINLVSILTSPLANLIKICNNPVIDLCKILDCYIKKC